MKTDSVIPPNALNNSFRSQINPIRSLTPQSLTHILDAFHQGHLASAAITWDAIERRDDVLQGVISKRKKAISRLNWKILTIDDSSEALQHKYALENFYNTITATHACDSNQVGGFSLLVQQMLDAIGKKYAVHEVVFQPQKAHHKQLTATFRFVPLWFFENTTGSLRFLSSPSQTKGQPLDPGSWLVTAGDGLMESSSIAYLFKQLPLRDWLVYSERNGMPGVKGITDARPGTPQWEAARSAVQNFGAEFNALMTRGTDIQAIDLTSRGELPYPLLVERMDRAMISLWLGSDLSTLAKNANGASVQSKESIIIQQADAELVSETLNAQVNRYVLKYLFNVDRGKAYIKIDVPNPEQIARDLDLHQKLQSMGMTFPKNYLYEHFGIPQPKSNEPTLTPNH